MALHPQELAFHLQVLEAVEQRRLLAMVVAASYAVAAACQLVEEEEVDLTALEGVAVEVQKMGKVLMLAGEPEGVEVTCLVSKVGAVEP